MSELNLSSQFDAKRVPQHPGSITCDGVTLPFRDPAYVAFEPGDMNIEHLSPNGDLWRRAGGYSANDLRLDDLLEIFEERTQRLMRHLGGAVAPHSWAYTVLPNGVSSMRNPTMTHCINRLPARHVLIAETMFIADLQPLKGVDLQKVATIIRAAKLAQYLTERRRLGDLFPHQISTSATHGIYIWHDMDPHISTPATRDHNYTILHGNKLF